MDAGIFITSKLRLRMWLILPPLLIVGFGMGANAWMQRASWQLHKAEALSEVLPQLVAARRQAQTLFKNFEGAEGVEMGSEERLISFLQDMAQQHDLMSVTVNMTGRSKKRAGLSVLSASVKAKGDLASVQLYLSEVKNRQALLSVNSIRMRRDAAPLNNVQAVYDVDIIFELLLLEDLKSIGKDL